MKASKLIEALRAFIETHGDSDVIDDDWQSIDGLKIVEDDSKQYFKLT